MIRLIVSVALLFFPFLSWAGEFQLTSSAFKNNSEIPKKYRCDGSDINPPLTFKNVPPGTKSLALTISDPDAPEGTWSHWVVYNMSPNTEDVIENTNPGVEGLSDFGKYTYSGPCPYDEKLHHYIFRAYALDEILDIPESPSLPELERAVRFHTIAKSTLVGTYQKKPF